MWRLKLLLNERFHHELTKMFRLLLILNAIINIDQYQHYKLIAFLAQVLAHVLSIVLLCDKHANHTTLEVIQSHSSHIT